MKSASSHGKGRKKAARTAGGDERQRRPETDEKLDQLLASAAKLMADKGFHDTSIRDVAAETGISLGNLYYYFATKDDLLFKIQQRTYSVLVEEQKKAVAEAADDAEKLRRIVQTFLAFYVSHRNELKVCLFEYTSLRGELFDEIRKIRREWYRLVADIVGRLLGRPHHTTTEDPLVRHRTLFIFGILNWIFMWHEANRDGSIDALGDEILDMIFNGLHGTNC